MADLSRLNGSNLSDFPHARNGIIHAGRSTWNRGAPGIREQKRRAAMPYIASALILVDWKSDFQFSWTFSDRVCMDACTVKVKV
jgi:hypothetical protein